MNRDKSKTASISATLISGTGRLELIPSIIPFDKSEKEIFWTKVLADNLSDKFEYIKIETNPDDSNGKHDVIITLKNESKIGVQVTEFTYELERTRQHIKYFYTNKLLEEIQSRGIKYEEQILISINFPYSKSKKPHSEKPIKIVDSIERLLENGIQERIYNFKFGSMLCKIINEGSFYLPNINNIGIDVNFDKLPRSLKMYFDCIDAIVLKKANSVSNWLIIWSLDFIKDRHWLGNEVIQYMKQKFIGSIFDKVFFVESLDGENFFHKNLKIDEIK